MNLKELRDAANKACDMAFDEKERPGKAINWADLGCVSAERYETDQGDTGYRVYIEEVSPDEHKLPWYIAGKLEEMGYKDIEVITAW